MTRTHLALVLVIALGIAAAAALSLKDRGAVPGFSLLTAEEVQQRETVPQSAERSITVRSSAGPEIRVNAPQGFSLVSPVDFDIRVEPRDGVAVDMASITIEYKLGPAWINLTRRVMKHASVKGTRLYARGADLPAGNHALRVSIRDMNQRLTRATVNFTVKGG